MTAETTTEPIDLPSLIGMHEDDAKAAIRAAGLRPCVLVRNGHACDVARGYDFHRINLVVELGRVERVSRG